MKLHLPKLLRAAVMLAAITSATVYADIEKKSITGVDADNNSVTYTYYNVGFAIPRTTGEQAEVYTGNLVLNDKDIVGAFTKTDTSGEEEWTPTHKFYWQEGDKPELMSKSLKVLTAEGELGNIDIYGSGRIDLGGRTHKNYYMGLYAGTVTVKDGATGTESAPNLRATMVRLNTLNVEDGSVVIRWYDSEYAYQGYYTFEKTAGDSRKQSIIEDAINVSGTGNLIIGNTNNGCKTDNWSKFNQHFLTALGYSYSSVSSSYSSPITITQEGNSNITVYGKTLVASGMTIDQKGGKMSFSASSDALRTFIHFDTLNNVNTISQSGDTSTEMSLGRMSAGSMGTSAATVNIIQTGQGTINLTNGAIFSSAKGKESSITQSGGGTVNLTGDFSKAVFNVDLTDGTLALTTSGTKLRGYTMTLASDVQLDNNGKLTIGTGTEGDAGVLNVTSGGTLNVMLDGTDAAISVGAASKDTNTVTGWTMASGSTFGIGLKKDYFEKVTVTNNTITINALVADVASGSSVDTSAFECEYTIGEIAGFASEQWKIEDGAGLIIKGDDVYLSATLTYASSVVHLTEGGEEDRDFAPVGGLDTKLVISENDIILSGDNSHSLGTEINEVEVTLAHENALGAGPVSTKGEAALKTAEDVTANLTGPIGNSGDLSISGKYAMDSGVTLEVADLPAGYICTEGNETADGNGFYREEIKDGGYVAVDNGDDATLTVTPGTTVEYDGEELVLGNDGLIGDRTPEYDTYYIRTDESSGYDVRSSEILTAAKQGKVTEVTVEMTEENGKLTADSAIDVNAVTGTLVTEAGAVVSGTLADTTVQAAGGTIAATISGRSEVTVSGTDVTTISGDNSYEGGTLIDGGSLLVGTATSLGTGDVTLDGHGTLDLNNNAVLNRVVVKGCTIKGASRFGGPLDVEGDLVLKDNTTATTLTMKGKGSITSDPAVSLEVDDVDVQTDADASITANVKVKESITLNNNGNALNVTGSLTLGDVTTLKLVGDYGDGDTLVTSTGDLTKGTVVLDYDSAYMLEQVGNSLVLTLRLKQDKADVAAQSNWGIATTSRAFVNTVRGQHSNTGCIANGRGTVWAAAFGAYNDLDGSDIDVKGAAVGVDAKVGSCSTVGIAFGYAEGEVSPTGLRDADQEGEYVALYGSHGLKKLSSTSCLSLDWVAAYGNTESEWNSLKWEQDSLQLNTRLNWNKKVTERLGMSVFGGLEYFATGSDTADGVKSGSIQNLRGEIGVGARYVAWGTPASQPVLDEKGATLAAARPGCEKLVLNGEIRYFNDMVRSNPVIRMNGASGGGENPGRQGMGIEAGATYRISERWSASANYSFNAMEDSVEHRANVGASYTF